MTLGITGMMLDIAIVIILLFSLYNGYKKGIVDRLLHFVSSLLIFGLAWFFSKTAAGFFSFYEIPGIDSRLMDLVSPVIGRVIGFVLLYLIFSFIRNIIFVLIHSVIEGIKEHISLVRWIDNGFGALFNVAKNTLLIYVLLAGMCMPIFSNGLDIVDDSKMGPFIMKISPTISEEIISFGQEIIDFTHVEQWSSRDFNMKDLIKMLNVMNEMDVLQENQFNELYANYQSQIDMIPSVSVTIDEYNELMNMIDKLPVGEPFKAVARSKIVSL